jgi:hypothetical protein
MLILRMHGALSVTGAIHDEEGGLQDDEEEDDDRLGNSPIHGPLGQPVRGEGRPIARSRTRESGAPIVPRPPFLAFSPWAGSIAWA